MLIPSLVHDFPGSRLEFSLRVHLRTGGRHEVPGEAAEGQLSPERLTDFTTILTPSGLITVLLLCGVDFREPA